MPERCLVGLSENYLVGHRGGGAARSASKVRHGVPINSCSCCHYRSEVRWISIDFLVVCRK
jgi:hypothetical protein